MLFRKIFSIILYEKILTLASQGAQRISLTTCNTAPTAKLKGADQGFLLPNGSNCEPPGESGQGFFTS